MRGERTLLPGVLFFTPLPTSENTALFRPERLYSVHDTIFVAEAVKAGKCGFYGVSRDVDVRCIEFYAP